MSKYIRVSFSDKYLRNVLFICAVRDAEDQHTYSEVQSASPANLTCFPNTDSSPSVFIHKLSRFCLVLNAANENKRHNYLCRHFSNISELKQLQYQQMVMDIKVNETLPGYLSKCFGIF